MAGKKPTAAPKKQVAGKDRPYSKLESLIKGSGYSNSQAANLAGIPVSTLTTIIRPETDLGTVRVSNLLALCRVSLFNRLNTETRGELIGIMRSLAKDPNRLMVWPSERD